MPSSNEKLSRLFLLITAIGVVHMGEQIIFGVEEYRMFRDLVSQWHALFPPSWTDEASVVLITIVFATVSMMIYVVMRGGAGGVIVIGLFGLLGVSEAHHWVEAIVERLYDPGLITSFAFVWLGVLILQEVWSVLASGPRVAAS